MPTTKPSGSRRTVQRSPKQRSGFRSGRSGVCEAQLWEFTGPSKFLREDEAIPIERVAASSLDQALRYMRRRHGDFNIKNAECVGMIALLAGSPLD